MKRLLLPLLLALTGCAHNGGPVQSGEPAPAQTAGASAASSPAVATAVRMEQIRADCINGRRLICGKVLTIVPDGIVVDSGYTELLRPPLTESWVVPATVSVKRNPAILEQKIPGTPCIGLALLTDLPKRPKVKRYDYVILMGYPAGQYVYKPVPDVAGTIRKFSAGLDTAVRLTLQAEAFISTTNTPVVR